MKGDRASILVGLLWCLALLSVVVIGVLYTARIDLIVAKNFGDRIQAHYLALAGVEKAKALLYQDARDRSRSSRNHTGDLYDAPQQFRNVALGRGMFRVIRRARSDEGGGQVFGVSDEESRLNANNANTDMLTNLSGMSSDTAKAIVAWHGGDTGSSSSKGEADYYLSLQPPYQFRNGPFQTIRELLMVRGVTPELLLGQDIHQNGLLPTADDTGEGSSEPDAQADNASTGWAGVMTVDSSVKNVNAAGQDRVNVQSADQAALTSVRGITPDIAQAIVSYRGRNQFQSISDLLDVTAPQRGNQNLGGTQSGGRSGQGASQSGQTSSSQSSSSGRKVISQDLLMDIADDISINDATQDQAGAININTAGLDVLACLPGVDRELAQAIIAYRRSNGFFPNIAWLLKVQGISQDTLKQIAPLVSARSETYRILSEGKVTSSGARQCIQVIVHVGLRDLTTLSYREDDL